MSTSPAVPTFDLRSVLDVLSDELISSLGASIADYSTESALKMFLVRDLPCIRFNLLADQLAISELWTNIRRVEVVTDLVLDLTTALRLHVSTMGPQAWADLNKHVVAAMSVFHNSKIRNDNCAIADYEDLERYVDESKATTFVESNPWLVAIFLIKYTEVVRKLCAGLAEHAKTQSNNKPTG